MKDNKNTIKSNNEFGKILKTIRKNKKITQGELADKTGMQYTYISKIERGEVEPKISTLLKIKSALNLSGNEILGEIDESVSGKLKHLMEQTKNLNQFELEYIYTTIELVISNKIIRSASKETLSENDYCAEQHRNEITKKEHEEAGLLMRNIDEIERQTLENKK